MAKLMQGRKKRLVLDIGSSAIRLCELAQTKTGYQLTKYFQKEFNADPSLDEEARRGAKRKAITELIKESKVRARKAIFGVPGQSVFTRSRALPPVPEYKVNQIVRYEIQQQIPFGLDQIAMDYQVLERTDAGGYEVMMAAIKVEVVDKHVDLIHEAKRSIDTVDVCPLAAYNWLKHTGEFGDTGECVALIDMGASTTDIIIERDNQFRFTRPLNVGGNDVTQAVAAAFGLNFTDAERLKRERGFAPTGDPQSDGKGGDVIGNVLQRIVSETMRSFAYFRSLPGGGQVNRVILCGGGACLRNIIPYMQRQLGVEVRIAQPLAGLAIAPSAQQVSDRPEQACVVLGLALRCCETVPLEINLIPPRVLEAARRKEQAFYWALSFATGALIMASIIPVSANENKLVQEEIRGLRADIRAYDPELSQKLSTPPPGAPPESSYVATLRKAQKRIKALAGNVDVLDQARVGRDFWLEELALINSCRPHSEGRVVFSTVETTTLAKAGGPRGRNAAPGRRPRPGAMASGVGAGRRGGPGASNVALSPGFPGIGASSSSGGAGAGRRGMAGGRPPRGNAAKPNQSKAMPKANGFIIHGFAETDQLIQSYVTALKEGRQLQPDGKYLHITQVRFSEASVQRVPSDEIYDAEPGPYRGGSARSGGGVRNPNRQQWVYSFTIEVRFDRSHDPDSAGSGRSAGPGNTPSSPQADGAVS